MKKNQKRLIFGIFSIFLLVITLSGCSLVNQSVNPVDDWENDVILAQNCGQDGLMCCPDKEPACNYGQNCCVDPNDQNNNYCADDCTCGQKETFCCAGNECDDGLICYNSYCFSCGDSDEICCANEECNDGLVCHNDKCVECGLPGNPCCTETGKNSCAGEKSHGNDRSECLNGLCAYCGFGGHLACQEEPKCNSAHLFNNGQCLSCGGSNQPCCQIDDKTKSACKQEQGLVCKLGFCSPIK